MSKKRQKPIELLSQEEVDGLIAAGSRRAPTGIRNRALVAFLAYSGARLMEALQLHPKDLALDRGEVSIMGKGSRQRVAAVAQPAIPHLDRWLDKRRALRVNGKQRLFCTLAGGPLLARYVQLMLARYARRAGIEKRVHPHGLRHWHAVAILRRGGLLPDIQQQLGHASLATTGEYLNSIAPDDRTARINGLAW
jgi:site-specific recombinase XerD